MKNLFFHYFLQKKNHIKENYLQSSATLPREYWQFWMAFDHCSQPFASLYDWDILHCCIETENTNVFVHKHKIGVQINCGGGAHYTVLCGKTFITIICLMLLAILFLRLWKTISSAKYLSAAHFKGIFPNWFMLMVLMVRLRKWGRILSGANSNEKNMAIKKGSIWRQISLEVQSKENQTICSLD